MIITKVTTGFVAQRFDTETNQWLDQEFIASDECNWENGDGEIIDLIDENVEDKYLHFHMIQPTPQRNPEEDDAFNELMNKYVEVYMDGIDFDCMSAICEDDLVSRLEQLTMGELMERVRDSYPALLEENTDMFMDTEE